MKIFSFIFLLFFCFLLASCNSAKKLPTVLAEVSGCNLVTQDSIWWLVDGGNAASLYCTNSKGFLTKEIKLPSVKNKDWEALCADPTGRFWYIGDFGNNCNCRKDLKIYRYDTSNGAVDSIEFSYPDQQEFPPKNKQLWNYDCESMVFFHDSLHVFSKNRFASNHFCKHYVLPAFPQKTSAILRDSFYLEKGVVTDAAILQEQGKIALVTYWGDKSRFLPQSKGYIWTIDISGSKDQVLGRQKLHKFIAIRQYESLALLPKGGYLLSNEKFLWSRQKMRKIKPKKLKLAPKVPKLISK